jgi:Outer membrane protein beta-barrel domain
MRYQQMVTALLCVVMLTPAIASAQSRVEVSGIVGWTISDGVEGDGILAGDGNIYNAIDIKDSFSWGFGIGFNVSETTEVGFLFNQQMSTLAIEGTTTRDVGDMNVTSYHPYFAYNFGESDAALRPFILFGLGATSYSSVGFTGIAGPRETGGETQFSTTWGAGVKYFAGPNVGIRISGTWTPTYISTQEGGWWCDPYWGCYVVGDAKYANQFHLNGGITFRF